LPGSGVFADGNGTIFTHCRGQQSVDRQLPGWLVILALLQAQIAPFSHTMAVSNRLTDICASTSDFIQIAAFVPTDKPIQRGSLNLGSQLFTLSRDGSCSTSYMANGFLVASFTGWLLLHLQHSNDHSCGFFLVHPFRSRFYLSRLLKSYSTRMNGSGENKHISSSHSLSL
jgi:hypothetical protein